MLKICLLVDSSARTIFYEGLFDRLSGMTKVEKRMSNPGFAHYPATTYARFVASEDIFQVEMSICYHPLVERLTMVDCIAAEFQLRQVLAVHLYMLSQRFFLFVIITVSTVLTRMDRANCGERAPCTETHSSLSRRSQVLKYGSFPCHSCPG